MIELAPKPKWKWSMLIAFGILIFSYLIQSIERGPFHSVAHFYFC